MVGGDGNERTSLLHLRLALAVAVLCGSVVAATISRDFAAIEPLQSDPEPTLSVAPLRFKAGRVLFVSGTNCVLGGRPMDESFVQLSRNVVISGGEPFGANARYPVSADGSWSGLLGVPASTPSGAYTVGQLCLASDQARPSPGRIDVVVTSDPPATVTAGPGAGTSEWSLVAVVVSGCSFEDGSMASLATAALLNSTGATTATASFPVGADGAGGGTMSAPADTTAGSYRIEVRCHGPLGALDAVAAQIDLSPPGVAPLQRTG